jgi:hypothetical protein
VESIALRGERAPDFAAATLTLGASVQVFMKAFHTVEPRFCGRALVAGQHSGAVV